MSHISLILSAVALAAFAIWAAPGIIGLNRGHVLRNIALWLGIFLVLALVYKNFGPGSQHPLFHGPAGMSAPLQPPAPGNDNKNGSDDGDNGYTPPGD